MREQVADGLLRLVRRRARAFDREELARSAVVLAPHPDDESLACAGTILRKRAAGAAVRIVFMTDGSRSHPVMPPAELARMRRAEGFAAAASLGIAESDCAFLEFEDGQLRASLAPAVTQLGELIARWQPAQMFSPCGQDWHPDHIATNTIAHRALALSGSSIELFEYSVYLWRSWPWSKIDGFERGRRTSVSLLARFATHVTHVLDCGDDLPRKRAALGSHRSQMERRGGDPTWWTLGDWGAGEFVARSLSGVELFRKR
jgi:LmbE family N-acetylglucosaminyl deacetylase